MGSQEPYAAPVVSKKEPAVDFNDLFSLRRPRDGLAGLSSGGKSMLKGVASGVTGLVAGPIIGAHRGGIKGCLQGAVVGVVGAAVMPVLGIGIGTFQIVRGVVNTREAMQQRANDKIWDDKQREWINKPDGTLITAEAAQASTKAFFKPGAAKGVDYYAVLQVPHNAQPEEIKKAYYMLARKYHPDKNPGDAEAHQRFQLLGEAYQVMSDPKLRDMYDRHGSEGLDDHTSFMDSGEFFNMLFGSEKFEHLVGELAIACAVRTSRELTPPQIKAIQSERVNKLAVNLKAMLQRHVVGDPAGFRLAMQAEAQELAAASFGDTMLHAIGRVYSQQADIYLGGFFGGIAAKMRATKHNMQSQLDAASAAIKVFQAHQKMEALQKEEERRAAAAAEEMAAAAANGASSGAARVPTGPSSKFQDYGGAEGPSSTDKTDGGRGSPSAGAEKSGQHQGPDRSSSKEGAGTSGQQQPQQQQQQGASTSNPYDLKNESAAHRAAMLQLEEDTLPLMLEAMWAANVLDVQSTVRKVCEKVLYESGVSSEERKARAKALKELGTIFIAAKAPEQPPAEDLGHEAGGQSSSQSEKRGEPQGKKASQRARMDNKTRKAKRQMEEAMLRLMEKRNGAEAD